MKKVLAIVLASVMLVSCIFAFSGCKRGDSQNMDIVLITDGATITDKGYNQSAWNGVKEYAEENDMTYRYYQPNLDDLGNLTVEEIGKYIELAVKDGAKYIVLPGEDFAVAAYEIAPTYSDVNFVLVDAVPHSKSDTALRMQQNVMCISFDNLQAGFLAGATAVIDGYTKLGYFGSVTSAKSGDYGAGFVQGSAIAADELQKPVILDYADYDSALLDYDYTINLKAEYVEIPTDSNVDYFTVNVVNGLGSGTYSDGENVTITANAPEQGKKFSHWEVKSDTDGVKDSKVNISSKKEASMNLLVEKCDCTITAVYEDCDTVAVNVEYTKNYEKQKEVYNTPVDSTAWITAPPAEAGMVFDHWECADEQAVEDANSKSTNVKVGKEDVNVTPVYVPSNTPTFTLNVENGTGSGAYLAGDYISVVADAPKEGYMFSKWVNSDNQCLSTGISMENEYSYTTGFEMVDRYASIVENMIDNGTQIVFGGGNNRSDSIETAIKEFDYPVYYFGAGIDESSKKNCNASVVNDYGKAVKLALESYKPASIMKADCSNGCIYVTGKSIDSESEQYNEEYAQLYNALASNAVKLINVQSGGDVRLSFNSKCLSLNYWIVEK